MKVFEMPDCSKWHFTTAKISPEDGDAACSWIHRYKNSMHDWNSLRSFRRVGISDTSRTNRTKLLATTATAARVSTEFMEKNSRKRGGGKINWQRLSGLTSQNLQERANLRLDTSQHRTLITIQTQFWASNELQLSHSPAASSCPQALGWEACRLKN